MKTRIFNIVLAFCATFFLFSCEEEELYYRSEYLDRVPTNVMLEDYGETSFVISWSYVEGATSYTVQLVDMEEIPTEDTIYTTTNEAAHEFSCAANTVWYARVRANFPANNYSNWVYLTYDDSDERAVLVTGRGMVKFYPTIDLIAASSSTLTYHWNFTGSDDADVDGGFELYLYASEDCSDESLVVGWTVPEESALFNPGAGNFLRFTFSGLEPSTTYYCKVRSTSYSGMVTDVLAGTTSAAAPAVTATAAGSAVIGDILVSEDFSKIYHGGDLAHFAAAYYITADFRSENIKASGMDSENCTLTRCTSNEFCIFDGGSVTAGYYEGAGLGEWAHTGTTAGRSGYLKMGTSSATGSLLTPELSALPDGASSVEVSFSAKNYSEQIDGSGADAGIIVVSAVSDATISSARVASGGTTLIKSADIDISDSMTDFKTYTVSLQNVTPDARICIETGAGRVLIDDIMVTYTGPSSMEKLETPEPYFDEDEIYSTMLTLKWEAVENAYTYNVKWWKEGDEDNAVEASVSTTSHTLTDLEPLTTYYAQVQACAYTGLEEYNSDYSTAVSCATNDQEVEVTPIDVTLVNASAGTLTFEWLIEDSTVAETANYDYNVALYKNEICTDLFVSWIVTKDLFTYSSDTNVRFTFTGLDPGTPYWFKVNADGNETVRSEAFAASTTTFTTVSGNEQAKEGDVIVAEDFSGLIHGGDLGLRAVAISTSANANRATYQISTGENPTDYAKPVSIDTEFNVYTGGSVSSDYTKATGLDDWCMGDGTNVSTRPGYAKIGGGSAYSYLATPVLSTIPEGATATVKVDFSALIYSQGTSEYGGSVMVAVADNVSVSSHQVSGWGTASDSRAGISSYETVDISSAPGSGKEFKDFSVTLSGVSNVSRIRISSNTDESASSNKTRFFLDNVVVIVQSVSVAEALDTPSNVSFEEPTENGTLVLTWGKVDNADSYSVEYWKTADSDNVTTVSVEADETSLTLTNLDSNTEYSARVKAIASGYDHTDSEWSDTATATTITPSDPTLGNVSNLTASASFSSVTLTWDAVTDANGYQVTYNGVTETVEETTLTVTDLDLETSYSFSVIALSADGEQYNSPEPATVSATTLYFKVVSTTTSNFVVELEQEGSEGEYTLVIEEDGTSRTKTFTHDYSADTAYGDGLPLRFVFNFVGDEWPDAYLSADKTYSVKVKTGAADSGNAYSKTITGSILSHTAAANEIFHEDFDRFMGPSPVDRAAGAKTTSKISSEAGMSTQFTAFSIGDWVTSGGAMNSGSGTYGDPYRFWFFEAYDADDDSKSWVTGTLGSGETHNAFGGCFRLSGDNANQSYIATPTMNEYISEATNVTVNFKTAVNVFWQSGTPGSPGATISGYWRRDQFPSCSIYVLHEDGTNTLVEEGIVVGVEGSEFVWKSQSVNIDGLLPSDRIMFTSVASSKSRYYLDEVSVVTR